MSLDLDLLLRAYANGIFPMADARDDPETFWVEPKTRAILPLDGLVVSRSLGKVIRQDRFRVTSDTAFARVISTCAAVTDERRDTWINPDIEVAFLALHELGHAHSIECWHGEELVGGLYGLALGPVFFGESMFSRATDASKVALAWLVARMRVGGFELLDCQFLTDHLASLGVIEISQKRYLTLLHAALAGTAYANGNQVSIVESSGTTSSGSAGAAGVVSGADWGVLEGFLGASGVEPSAEGLVSIASSPGKLILHSLIQTS
jgi:leucyl/phenylalanyl-tRNA---protein transferase